MSKGFRIHENTSKEVFNHLIDHPSFTIKCNLTNVLKDRGLKLKELSDLTGIRIASLSELSNMKRSTISVPHILVIAKALRILDISELFEFEMHQSTRDEFIEDRGYIDNYGVLPHQEIKLKALRIQRKKDRLEEKHKAKLRNKRIPVSKEKLFAKIRKTTT